MLKFEDFIPERIDKPLLGNPTYESLKSVLARANDWIGESGLKIVNVETIVLPLHTAQRRDHYENNSDNTFFPAWPYGQNPWLQIVRVWYEY
jgi:hypothetical protein